ncbi:Sec-independent protein translocase subunit TatA [Microbacterium sp.]|uniref:Sec-independent protein translocase subunit TatA n=1 Tax=Microbacterium sp. TaxID=51671 RepID=UPI0039E4C8E2
MPSNLFAGPHIWIILLIIILLFGAAKLPALARSLGQSARIFKGEIKSMKDESSTDTAASTVADATAAPRAETPAAPQTSATTAEAGGTTEPKP